MPGRPLPRFYGVETYQDPHGRFSFRYPTGWVRFEVQDHEGVMYVPILEDLETSFSTWITALGEQVIAEDLEELKAGVEEGLAQLAGCQVEAASDLVLGNLIKFERVFTYRDGEAVRKRKQWLLYVDTWLMVVTWQGSSPEEYEYWLPMGNYAFATFNLPEAVWLYADREKPSYR